MWFHLRKFLNIPELKSLPHKMGALFLRGGEEQGRGGPSLEQMPQMLGEFQRLTGHVTGSTVMELRLVS